MAQDKPTELTPAERRQGQRAALRANLFTVAINNVLTGGVLQLYAMDVLGYTARMLGVIRTLTPLTALLRFPLMGPIRRAGLVRTLLITGWVRFGVVVALLLLPVQYTSYPLLLTLLILFGLAAQLGMGSVWQPLVRQITTTEDRGSFFGRMRFGFHTVTTLCNLGIALLIGSAITDMAWRVLLTVAAFGILNHLHWIRQVPEIPLGPARGPSGWRGLLAVIRTSPLLRRPLAIQVLVQLTFFPLYLVYLRQFLHMPANVIAVYTLVGTVGNALALLIWGRVADAVGFRPMLIGLLVISVLTAPLQFLFPIFPETFPGWHALGTQHWTGLGFLMLFGFLDGAINSGIGIATTSIQHYHVEADDSLEAMNVYTTVWVFAESLGAILATFVLQDLAFPAGSTGLPGGFAHFDWVNGWQVGVVGVIKGVVILLALGLPNARPHFGVGDFFQSLAANPVRLIVAERRVHDEREEQRAELARYLGGYASPMRLDPLLDLLDDPSYDVRVEAVRSLARTGSPVAGERLLKMLTDEQKSALADHLAWALGELRHRPAVPALVALLQGSHHQYVRAAAARALGKIGDRTAIEPICTVLQDESNSLHLTASCCRALLGLEAVEQAPLVFACIRRLNQRDERFELCDVLSDWLGISNHWLVASDNAQWLRESLMREIELRPQAWRAARQPILDALQGRDLDRIRALASSALARLPRPGPAERAMVDALNAETTWSALCVLASAWLLLALDPPAASSSAGTSGKAS